MLAPVLRASKCTKDKDDGGGDRIISDLPDPAMELQVAGIDPAYGPSGEAFTAEILGSGFEIGSKVSFAGTDAQQVSWKDSSTLGLMVPALEPGYYDVTVSTPGGARRRRRSR